MRLRSLLPSAGVARRLLSVDPGGVAGGLWNLVLALWRRGARDRLLRLAAEVAFYLLLALPPALLVLLGLIGWVAGLLDADVVGPVEEQITRVTRNVLSPGTANGLVRRSLEQLASSGRATVTSLGVIVTLWAASRATTVLMETVRIASDVEESRSPWRRRLVAYGATAVALVVLAVVLPVVLVGPREIARVVGGWWPLFYWPALAVASVATVTTLLHLVRTTSSRWRHHLPGGTLAVVLWAGGTVLLKLYTAFALRDGSVYGPLAAPLVMLSWLYLAGLALLLGAELNAEMDRRRGRGEGREGRESRVRVRATGHSKRPTRLH